MMHDQFRGRHEWHPIGCRCDDCAPPGPADGPELDASVAVLMIIAGVIVGLVIDLIWGWAVNGPSLSQAFGF